MKVMKVKGFFVYVLLKGFFFLHVPSAYCDPDVSPPAMDRMRMCNPSEIKVSTSFVCTNLKNRIGSRKFFPTPLDYLSWVLRVGSRSGFLVDNFDLPFSRLPGFENFRSALIWRKFSVL